MTLTASPGDDRAGIDDLFEKWASEPGAPPISGFGGDVPALIETAARNGFRAGYRAARSAPSTPTPERQET